MNRLALTAALLCLVPTAPALAREAPAGAAPSKAEVERYAMELLVRRYRADRPGGAVLVARGDTVLFRAARGQADVGKNVPLRPDSVFRIGSATKQFAAAGLLKLVEAGKVRLDDPLSKYLPDFPQGERITVLELLNHTSGVRSYTAFKGYMAGPVQRDLTTAQMVDVFKDEPLVFEPGAKWEYSNSGYVLVGAVIEAATGEPWFAYLDRVLFKPLGMRNTGYALDSRLKPISGYTYEDGKLMPARAISMTQPHAAGSLVSNVDDLFKWNRALHEGRVLKSATYAQMVTPAGKAKDVGYGFGLFKGTVRRNDMLSHGGGIFGFITALDYLPGPDISVVVLENDDQDDDRAGVDSADTFARRLAAEALGDPYPVAKAVPVAAAVLKEAEGIYRFDGDVRRLLRVVDGKLTAKRGARGDAAILTPIASDDFLYPDGLNRLKLERDASGKISAVRFFPSGDGDGDLGQNTNEPLPSAVAEQPSRAAAERLVGTYANAGGGLTLKVYVEGAALLGQIAGQPPVTLRAKSPTEFAVEETDASIEFPSGTAPAANATIRQKGREIKLDRMP